MPEKLSRRSFLKLAAFGGAGLLFSLSPDRQAETEGPTPTPTPIEGDSTTYLANAEVKFGVTDSGQHVVIVDGKTIPITKLSQDGTHSPDTDTQFDLKVYKSKAPEKAGNVVYYIPGVYLGSDLTTVDMEGPDGVKVPVKVRRIYWATILADGTVVKLRVNKVINPDTNNDSLALSMNGNANMYTEKWTNIEKQTKEGDEGTIAINRLWPDSEAARLLAQSSTSATWTKQMEAYCHTYNTSSLEITTDLAAGKAPKDYSGQWVDVGNAGELVFGGKPSN